MPLIVLILLTSCIAAEADLPTVPEHEPYRVTKTLHNPYDRAVKIVHIDTTCACSHLEPASRFILPRESIPVEIAVDNKQLSGPQSQTIAFELSDPECERLLIKLEWNVIPDVTVDLQPPNGPFDQRPEAIGLRDVYAYTEESRPGEMTRKRKVIRLTTPADQAPEGGLQVSEVRYAGKLWGFTVRQQAPDAVLIVADGQETTTANSGKFSEEVTLITNHPHKPEISLLFHTAIDEQVGTAGWSDAWGHLR